MLKSIFVTFIVLASFLGHTAEVNWAKLDEAIRTKAEYQESPHGIYGTLKDVIQDGDRSRQANYFSGVGGFDAENRFLIGHYEIVSEVWTKEADKIKIDQWLFVLDYQHQLTYKAHYLLLQDFDGRVLEHRRINETNAAYEQKLDAIFNFWETKLSY
jgi:hypothetical protein